MQVSVESRPASGIAVVTLDLGEELLADGRALVAMSAGVTARAIVGGLGGGVAGWVVAVARAVGRHVVGGDPSVVCRFRATAADQQVWLAPAGLGDVESIELDGRRVIVLREHAFLGAARGVHVVRAGRAGLLSCRGRGELLVASHGALERVDVDGEVIVDVDHLVAFEGALGVRGSTASGWWAEALPSAGGVRLRGAGTVWVQSRALAALAAWAARAEG